LLLVTADPAAARVYRCESAEREKLQSGDVGWLREGVVAGHVRVELLMDAAEDLDSLRHMRTIVIVK
jgi:hypothetical protein